MTTLTWVGFACLALFYATGTLGAWVVDRRYGVHAAVLVWRWSALGVLVSCFLCIASGGY